MFPEVDGGNGCHWWLAHQCSVRVTRALVGKPPVAPCSSVSGQMPYRPPGSPALLDAPRGRVVQSSEIHHDEERGSSA